MVFTMSPIEVAQQVVRHTHSGCTENPGCRAAKYMSYLTLLALGRARAKQIFCVDVA